MGGSRAQMALAEREIAAGRHAEWPMMLASLPHLADPVAHRRSGPRPLWTYAHVPAGSTVDLTETVTAMFERVAPGFRDLVVAARACPPPDMSDHNANYVGRRHHRRRRDAVRAMVGPTLRLNPWTTPIPKAYLCSSATPPGTGVHGMAGYYAARTVLRREFGIKKLPSLSP